MKWAWEWFKQHTIDDAGRWWHIHQLKTRGTW